MKKETKRGKNTKKESVSKVSYHYKPDNMTLEEWQVSLRRQAAAKEQFAISELNKKDYPGYYKVINPLSGNMNTGWYIGVKEARGIIARAWTSKPIN